MQVRIIFFALVFKIKSKIGQHCVHGVVEYYSKRRFNSSWGGLKQKSIETSEKTVKHTALKEEDNNNQKFKPQDIIQIKWWKESKHAYTTCPLKCDMKFLWKKIDCGKT